MEEGRPGRGRLFQGAVEECQRRRCEKEGLGLKRGVQADEGEPELRQLR